MRGNSVATIITGVIGLIVLACVIFIAVLGFKAASNDTTFVDEWNNVWGVETVEEENPDVTDDEQNEEQTPSDVEETETKTPVLTMLNNSYVIM